MCTVTWSCAPTGFEVVFSRDEQRSRVLALPPRPLPGFDPPVLAPYDPAGGGTWLMVNAHGLAVCILNHTAAAVSTIPMRRPAETDVGPAQRRSDPASAHATNGHAPRKRLVSRGHLPLALAGFTAVADCASQLRTALESAVFNPFLICAFDLVGRHAAWCWNGQTLEARTMPRFGMASTSSVDTARIVAHRQERFRAVAATLENGHDRSALWHFHEAADTPSDAASVRMSRADARTVSLIRLSVRPEAITMDYAPREDDGGFAIPTRHRLSRFREIAAR